MPEEDGQRDEPEIINFDYDPMAPREDIRVMKLVFSAYVNSAKEYNEARGLEKPIPQWRLIWEDWTRDPDDTGKRSLWYDNANLVWLDSEGKQRKFGPGSIPHAIASGFAGCNVPHSPKELAHSALVGQFFRCSRQSFSMGPYTPKRAWIPVEYIGIDLPDKETGSMVTQEEEPVPAKVEDW